MRYLQFLKRFVILLFSSLFFSFLVERQPTQVLKFPYTQAGWNNREAAAHLVSRFTFGAQPGQIDSVLKIGLENWFLRQLRGNLPDDSLEKRLAVYDAIHLSNTEVCSLYPKSSFVIAMAIKDSVISKDSVGRAVNKKAYNEQVQAYMQQKGYRSNKDLQKQFLSENIVRAVYTNNQLQEVLTNFWFNHFNVSFTKSDCANFIPGYERDVVRPRVFGKFDELLLATAKSPAMLYFLDNFISADSVVVKRQPPLAKPLLTGMDTLHENYPVVTGPVKKKEKRQKISGLNENYAREVIELHTLGVDGGYTQKDVREAARLLTGWTVYPISTNGPGSYMKAEIAKASPEEFEAKGFIRDGDFLFVPTRHDKGEKTVIGQHFVAGGGYSEGVRLLTFLAHHVSTARFISKKLAVRFVCDNPPTSLIDKMSKSFIKHDGDIREVLITMVNSVEFWDKKYSREKIKTPFELAVSASRALHAEISDPYVLYTWIARMGQKSYYYQAPTGFPDAGKYWINTSGLLNRMNFSMSFAFQQIAGVQIDMDVLNKGNEPGSAQEALETFCKLLLPERNLDKVMSQLAPMLNDPGLAIKLNKVITKQPLAPAENLIEGTTGDMMTMGLGNNAPENDTVASIKNKKRYKPEINNPVQAQVVGMILGSPEFQRR